MNYLYKFFDKTGLHLDPDVDETGVYNIDVYLDPVSVGLFETQQIHIFEEVYEKITQSTPKLPILNDSKLYSVLSAIKNISESKGYAVDKDLYYLFVQNLTLNTVGDYLRRYSPMYVDIYNNNITKVDEYRLTESGEDLLMYAEHKIEKRILANQGYESTLVRPRFKPDNPLNFSSDDYGFYFKWKDVKCEAINIFGIIENDVEITDNTVVGGKKNTYPSVIQFPNEVLSDLNKFNKLIKPNFLCDVAEHDYVLENYVFSAKKILIDDYGNPIESNKDPITLNICANSDIEGYYENTLEVFIINSKNELFKFARINFFVEIIGEDGRLSKILENFGREIDVNDYYVIRDYDLNDDKLDYIKINEKRKELLLESENIFPYLGSYKALYNGLKWLGWQDITLREYFYNIQTVSPSNIDYQYVDIPMDFSLEYNAKFDDKKRSEYTLKKYTNLVVSDTWKKTTRMGLICPYNHISGDLGDDGLPVVVSNGVDFNAEELLVKLYGLKKFLYKYLLPHNARIINIGLEGIYFTKVQFVNWNNILPIIDLVKKPKFTISVKHPKQIKANLFALIRKFADLNKETLWVDEFETIGDFTRANLKLSDFGMLTPNSFAYNDDGQSDEMFSRLGVPKIQTIFDTIKSFLTSRFDSYVEFERWIQGVLSNSKCSRCGDVEKIENNDFKGGVFLLEARENVITYSDISHIPFWMFTVQNPVNKRCLGLSDINHNDDYDFKIIVNQKAECTECDDVNKGSHINWNFEYFNIHKSSQIEWMITHENLLYCDYDEGNFSNSNYKLFIGPYIGKYDVSCVIKDDFNFPNIVRKNSAIEVIDEDFEIYAIGRDMIKVENWGSKVVSFRESIGTHFNLYRNTISDRTFTQCAELSFESLEFFPYLESENYLNYTKNSPVVHIDTSANMIKVDGGLFFEYFDKFKKNWDGIYLSKNTNSWTYFNLRVSQIKKNSIIVDDNYDLDLLYNREIINIYEIYESFNFSIQGKKIKILVPNNLPINIFRNDSIITLTEFIDGVNDKSFDYKVNYVEYNFIEHSVILSIDDINDNLVFVRDASHDTTAKYNYSNWQKLTMKYNINTFRVTKCEGREIFVSGDFSKLRKISLKNDNDDVSFFIQSGLQNIDFIKTPIEDVEVLLERELNESIIVFKDSVCNLTHGYSVVYAEFDVLNAKNNSKFEEISFQQMSVNRDSYTFSNFSTQTFDSLSYNSGYTTGFTISGMDNVPAVKTELNNQVIYLKFNGIESLLEVDDVDAEFYSNLGDGIQIRDALNRAKRENVLKSLSSIKTGPLSGFEYRPLLDTSDKIEAISKGDTSHSIYRIESSIFEISDNITYPKIGWYEKQYTEFKNIQNPDYSNHLCRAYIENKHLFDREFTDEDIMTSSYIRGVNDFGKTFIQNSNFEFMGAKPLFFTISNKGYFNLDEWEFEWVLYHQNSDRILIKSNIDYISYIINLEGVYDITLKLVNKITNKIIIKEKKSFFIKK